MILTVLAFAVFGIYLLIRGDGPARFVGVLLILVSALFGFLFWVALYMELPPTDASLFPRKEIRHV